MKDLKINETEKKENLELEVELNEVEITLEDVDTAFSYGEPRH